MPHSTHLSHDNGQAAYRSTLEADRLARQENDCVRQETNDGQFNLFDDRINRAIIEQVSFNAALLIPEFAAWIESVREKARETSRAMKRDTAAERSGQRPKLILLAQR